MSKILPFLFGLLLFGCGNKYDDTALRDDLNDLENRVAKLEKLCNETNTNLFALQAIVVALQSKDYIEGVDPLTENGKVVGYTIKFTRSNPIVIYHGKDGDTPQVGISKDSDGVYYWTLNGEFTVVNGEKIKAQGLDGVTPNLEIRDDYWWISYDRGNTWMQLGKATGENGSDADNIEITQDENCVYFTLSNGEVIKILKVNAVEDIGTMMDDLVFMTYCYENFDINKDGKISRSEANAVIKIVVGTPLDTMTKPLEIRSLNGIEYFPNLERLCCQKCSLLTSVDLSQNHKLTEIGFEFAFTDCSNLTSIIIPESVTLISSNAFSGCRLLSSVTIPSGVTSIRFSAFQNSGLTSVVIPPSVTSIESNAFNGCSQLTSVTISSGVTSIGSSAFQGCGITSVTIPESVSSIGSLAFCKCSSLTSVYCKPIVPPSVLSSSKGNIFDNTPADLKIYVPTASIVSYQSANSWSSYSSRISEFDFAD